MTRTICIYHGNCADGFTAAWAVWKALGSDVAYVAGIYAAPPPDVTGADVIMVDFSYKRPVLDKMAETARSILILDHHKTAAEDLAGLPQPDRGGWDMGSWASHLDAVDAGAYAGLPAAIFDMHRSGAQLAWDFFHADMWRPRLVDYVADRDLWRFDLPDSRAISEWVFSHAYRFATWTGLALQLDSPQRSLAAQEGAAILRKHEKDVTELLAVTRRQMVIGGIPVPVANMPYTMASDAAGTMAGDAPFAATYYDRPGGRVFSLRSRADGGADVAAIAARYGGGGHRNAAGFQAPAGWEGDL